MNANMPGNYYIDPTIYVRERKNLFATSWQLLGDISRLQLPGSYLSEEIAGMKVLVIRGRDGELRGFRNVCRHRGAQLLPLGSGFCGTIRCPYHNWVYELNGSLKTVPWFGESEEFDLNDWPLAPISVEQWRGLLFVSISPKTSLDQQLGETSKELEDVDLSQFHFVEEHRLRFNSNWKIYTDNFVEGYHIPGIHPEFFAAIDFNQFETTVHPGLVKMTAPANKDLFYLGRWYWMWPNWTLSLFSGGYNTSRINPVDENHTELVYHFYFEDMSEATSIQRAETIARNLKVIRQDFQICLETHQNYSTDAYSPGPLSPRHEKGVAYFQNRYRQLIDDRESL